MDERMRLLREHAHKLGIQYTGDDPEELEMFLAMAAAERGKNHPVACYGLSHDGTAPQCRICQLRVPCGELCGKSRVEVLQPAVRADPIACEVCGEGRLTAEVLDAEGALVDYACEGGTPGCPNRVTIQCGWEPAAVKPEIVIAKGGHSAEEEGGEEGGEEGEEEGEEEAEALSVDLDDPQSAIRDLVKESANKEIAQRLEKMREQQARAQSAPFRGRIPTMKPDAKVETVSTVETIPAVAPKKRGRPPKAKPVEVPLVVSATPEAAPKRRGRPPKVRPVESPVVEAPPAEALIVETAPVEAEAPPKKRGRPPKAKPVEAPVVDPAPAPVLKAIVAAEPEAVPKRRGRPPKVRQDGVALVYRYEGAVYPSLAQVVRAITGGNGAWSAQRFFGVSAESLSAGESVTREWDGKTHRVTVELPNG